MKQLLLGCWFAAAEADADIKLEQEEATTTRARGLEEAMRRPEEAARGGRSLLEETGEAPVPAAATVASFDLGRARSVGWLGFARLEDKIFLVTGPERPKV